MPTTPRPVHPLIGVLGAVFATFAFIWSSNIDGWFRFVLLALGLVLLAVAVAAVTATRRGAPGSGWLPSRDSQPRDGAKDDPRDAGRDPGGHR